MPTEAGARFDWRALAPSELERQFNPRVTCPEFQRHLDDYRRLGDAARARIAGEFDRRYGPGPQQCLDIHCARPGRLPMVLLIHGGYWRGLDKSDMTFVAEPLAAAGALVLNVNYDLCPAITLDTVVGQVRDAVVFAWREAERLGGDRDRLHLLGHSAGAHLAAMCLNHDWTAAGLPAQPIAGVTAVSGVYDLAPVLGITVNADVRLDTAMAARNSPLHRPPRQRLPMLLAVGDDESPGWIAQTTDYLAACRDAGVPADFLRVPGRDHFSILFALAEPRQPLARALMRQVGLE